MLNFFLIVHKNFPKISRELQKFPGNFPRFPGRDFPGTSPKFYLWFEIKVEKFGLNLDTIFATKKPKKKIL